MTLYKQCTQTLLQITLTHAKEPSISKEVQTIGIYQASDRAQSEMFKAGHINGQWWEK